METSYNNTVEISGIIDNWDSHAKHLKEQFPLLTDADLVYEVGRENELLCKLETRLYKNREEVIGLIKKYEADKLSWQMK